MTTLERIAKVVRRIIGVPDYDAYVRHQQLHHPECAVLSPEAFGQDMLKRRYEKPGSRCC